jgi:hypothetical protein
METLLAGMLFCSPIGVEQSIEYTNHGFVLWTGEESLTVDLIPDELVNITAAGVVYEGGLFTTKSCV